MIASPSPAFIFSLRVGIALTIASLFILIPPAPGTSNGDAYLYPESGWVYVTCFLVTWFPTLDAASTIKKSLERVSSTIVGATLAIAIGFVSLQIGPGTRGQAAFLGVVTTMIQFGWPYYTATQRSFGYPSALGFMTTLVIALGFYDANPVDPWKGGCLRAGNLVLGCIIGGLVSVLTFPVSIERIMEQKTRVALKELGKASHLLIDSVLLDHDENRKDENPQLPPISAFILNDDAEEDEVHTRYASAFEAVSFMKTKLPLIRYDPFLWKSRHFCKAEIQQYAQEVSMLRARMQRLLMNVVHLDSIVRMSSMAGISESDAHMLRETGRRLETVLTTDDVAEREEIAHLLLTKSLVPLRELRMNIQTTNASSSDFKIDQLEEALKNEESPISLGEHKSYITVDDALRCFYQSLEFLILRTVRLTSCTFLNSGATPGAPSEEAAPKATKCTNDKAQEKSPV